jgi:endonuclease YncB( thermonuclease family)
MRLIFAVSLAAILAAPVLADDVRLLDADTIQFNGIKYRLDGIDAPEANQKCRSPDGTLWFCGQAATAALAVHVAGKAVTCTDVGEDRRYGRRVGRCFADGASIESWLVRAGWAVDFKKHSGGRFAIDEDSAREARLGIWASCFANPRDHRYTNKTSAILLGMCSAAPDELALVRDELFGVTPTIKAKVFAAGRQMAEGVRGIFHREGCASFSKMPNEQDGVQLMFFASAEDALANGFREARNCMRQ